METAFWIIAGLILYSYIGYPLVLCMLEKVRSRDIVNGNADFSVSVIIPAHNEESNISQKIENTLGLKYQREPAEIIIISDGSTDDTVKRVRQYESDKLRLIEFPCRVGKAAALNAGIGAAKGEILVFSDVGALAREDCLTQLLSNFADPAVGCASTEDIITSEGGEGVYVRLEMALRRLETKIGSCTAVSGSMYAVRRSLCPVFLPHSANDLLTALYVVKRDYRVVSDPRAVAEMGTVGSQKGEYSRKVRTILTGLGCLNQLLPMLNPLKYGIYAVQLFSHKILRWSGGILLVGFLLTNAFLLNDSFFYVSTFSAQLLVYAASLFGIYSDNALKSNKLIRTITFFVLTNAAALSALWLYARGKRVTAWQPSQRHESMEAETS